MKKLISLFCLFMLIAFVGNAQIWEWVKTIAKGATENGRNIGTDKYGNIYVVGISRYTTGGSSSNSWHHEWFYKFDISGKLLWERKIENFFSKAVTDPNGNTYITSGNKLSKYDHNGNMLWNRIIPHANYFNTITINPKGGVVITGSIRIESNLMSLITSFDENGTVNWERRGDFYANGSMPLLANADNLGNIFIANIGSEIGAIIKFDNKGEKVWEKEIWVPFPGKLTIDKKGDFYIYGSYHNSNPLIVNGVTYTSDSPYGGKYVIKLNPNLEPVWVKDFHEQSINVSSMLTDSVNNIYLLGSFVNSFELDNIKLTSANSEVLVIKLNENGKLIWVKNSTGGVSGTGATLEAMTIDTEGNILISGSINGNFSFDSQTVNSPDMYGDMLIAKISGNEIIPVESTTIKINEEQGNSLYIYPNPTRSHFVIHYDLLEASQIKFKVRTITGAVIYEATEQIYSGTFQKEIDVSRHAPGVYFVELEMDKERLVRKIVVKP